MAATTISKKSSFEDPKIKALDYIEEKKIKTLFLLLTSKLLLAQPEDTINFLIDELQNIKIDQAQQKTVRRANQLISYTSLYI